MGDHAGMSEAVRIITEQVRSRVRRDGVDLAYNTKLAEKYVRDEVQRYAERALGNSLPLIADDRQAAREVVASLTGFGALQPVLDDPGIEEIWIISPKALRSLILCGLSAAGPHRVRRNRKCVIHEGLGRGPRAVVRRRPKVAIGVQCHRRGPVAQSALHRHDVAP